MAWQKNLAGWLNGADYTTALTEFSGDLGRANRIAKLSKNPSVAGNQQIAEIIADECEVVCFKKGQALIEQGGVDDDVFYLLAGEANIVLNKQKITFREAPTQVGEMAARSGKGRTATVSARSDVVVVARLTAEKFREIETAFPQFRERLSVELEARFRERLTAQKVYAENLAPTWTIASIIIGIAAAILAWYVAPQGWNIGLRSVAAVLAGFLSFVAAMISNPAYRWRNLASLVGLSIVSYVFLGRHFSITADGGYLGNARLELISEGAGQSDFAFSLVMATLLIVFVVAALADWLHLRN